MSHVISRPTDAMVAIDGENLLAVTGVKVDEVKSGVWGIGGRTLRALAVTALAGGKTVTAR